jgi:hypothetical protein
VIAQEQVEQRLSDRLAAETRRAEAALAAAEAPLRGLERAMDKAVRRANRSASEDDHRLACRRIDEFFTAQGRVVTQRLKLRDLLDPARIARERAAARRALEDAERLNALGDDAATEPELPTEPLPARALAAEPTHAGVPASALKPKREFPRVVDTGDGLAQMSRGDLRERCRSLGLATGGHKAVLVERLRESGVTA